MSPYDPQRSRHRPSPADREPAPVDALLEPQPIQPPLPAGADIDTDTDVDVDDAGTTTVPTGGDDVVVGAAEAKVEVRADTDEVVVPTAEEAIYVDAAPRSGDDQRHLDSSDRVGNGSGAGRRELVAALLAVLVAIVALVVIRNRRR